MRSMIAARLLSSQQGQSTVFKSSADRYFVILAAAMESTGFQASSSTVLVTVSEAISGTKDRKSSGRVSKCKFTIWPRSILHPETFRRSNNTPKFPILPFLAKSMASVKTSFANYSYRNAI
ncbi:hypothetical protein SLA2020_414450 [Shorea laevis]